MKTTEKIAKFENDRIQKLPFQTIRSGLWKKKVEKGKKVNDDIYRTRRRRNKITWTLSSLTVRNCYPRYHGSNLPVTGTATISFLYINTHQTQNTLQNVIYSLIMQTRIQVTEQVQRLVPAFWLTFDIWSHQQAGKGWRSSIAKFIALLEGW